jgi:hypothetical protein
MMAVPKSARITLVALVSVLLGVLFGPSLIPLDAGAHDAPAVSAHHGPPAP